MRDEIVFLLFSVKSTNTTSMMQYGGKMQTNLFYCECVLCRKGKQKWKQRFKKKLIWTFHKFRTGSFHSFRKYLRSYKLTLLFLKQCNSLSRFFLPAAIMAPSSVKQFYSAVVVAAIMATCVIKTFRNKATQHNWRTKQYNKCRGCSLGNCQSGPL